MHIPSSLVLLQVGIFMPTTQMMKARLEEFNSLGLNPGLYEPQFYVFST